MEYSSYTTGRRTMTEKYLIKKIIGSDTLMTYGDGVSDVNIKRLINFHENKKTALTAVRPSQIWCAQIKR